MKRLHRMIIGAFLGPLSVTFAIVLFILTMQFLWKYVDDMMGKGLPGHVIAELLIYAMASIVPLAIPLAVLLSSIMTMGGLGERSELVPLRSAGMHLFSIIKPLMVVCLMLTGLSFYFNNNLLPIANLELQSLLYDVMNKKPAMNLKPGVFYQGIEGISIRVREKDEDTGLLHDVLIYDHREPFQGNRTVVRARTGTMQRTADGVHMVLTLNDGRIYDEHSPNRERRGQRNLLLGTFDRDVVRFEIPGLTLARTDQELFKDHYKMLTLGQLQEAEARLKEDMGRRQHAASELLLNGLHITRQQEQAVAVMPAVPDERTGLTVGSDPDMHAAIHETAINILRNHMSYTQRTEQELASLDEMLDKYHVEWHRKLMLSFAVMVFFFIGAPLGAIIRKGGMGLPTLFAIIFFLIFHIVSFSTEKLVVAGKIAAWPGMWWSTFMLLPMGIFLTWKAATDSPLLDRDAYYRGWERLRKRFRSGHADPATVQ